MHSMARACAVTVSVFIEPFDVLFLRGNKLFGASGSYGESLVLPWPSVPAGAIRSALLAEKGHDLGKFARSEIEDSELGTPESPQSGTFRLSGFHLARRFVDGRIERLYAAPVDLSVTEENGRTIIRRMQPKSTCSSLQSSCATPQLAVLAEQERSKPQTGYWLPQEQWTCYLRGKDKDLKEDKLLRAEDLWKIDERVGIALDPTTRRAADGQLFSMQAVALHKAEHQHGSASDYSVGFLADISGAELPEQMLLRFGGDGRAAQATTQKHEAPDECGYQSLRESQKCRLILTSPGLFEDGWMPTGIKKEDGSLRFELGGVKARLVCAAVPRAEVVSGFDVAKRRPKPAQRVAPTGSVYWLDELEASEEALRGLAEQGLWSDPEEDPSRSVEGFNRFTFAKY